MQAFLVVNAFQKMPDGCARIVQIAVFLAVHLLVFQRFHERFAEGIVVRISFPAHADRDLALLQQTGVIAGSVLCAEQRIDREGSSPSGAQMRGAVSKSGDNTSLAGESGRYGEV